MRAAAMVMAAALAVAALEGTAAAQTEVRQRERRVVVQIDESGPLHIETRSARRGFLGVNLLDLTPEFLREYEVR